MDNLFNRLSRKNMKFTENLHWGIYFIKRWENAFAHHLHQKGKERIILPFSSIIYCVFRMKLAKGIIFVEFLKWFI